ncbi:hypothetical protein EVAR_23293_1 [Eumeta japonica]|uniref:Uncharacterized protein n=1 Tax=Eumeta variegata TaxID=151549 RepID=A0A4C1V6C6_EUMVA|nr:hypothetical protein EVAR_23293_1 [Eumeta japonica]
MEEEIRRHLGNQRRQRLDQKHETFQMTQCTPAHVAFNNTYDLDMNVIRSGRFAVKGFTSLARAPHDDGAPL